MGCLAAALTAGCLDTFAPTAETTLGLPEGWDGSFDYQAGIGLTRSPVHSGRAAAYLSGQGSFARQATLLQSILPDNYLGKRVRLSAWVKPEAIFATYAGLWMRVDGAYNTLAFDNMLGRAALGTGVWREVSIVLDVPTNAVGIAFGALFNGAGTLLVDDMTLEVVDSTVPVTDRLAAPTTPDSNSRALQYQTALTTPANLDFEGTRSVTTQTLEWLKLNSVSLAGSDPALPLTDLAAFGQMIGNARLIGLGEGTHGTREFQHMKHRLLRYLVEQKGFTHFAIEATSPESEDINRYVLTGEGDPVRLVSTLRFWTWNTQEMVDMIRWMRQWNSTASPERRVQFHGVDIQQPGGAMDTVEAFVARVDPERSGYVRTRFACFDPYKSRGATFGVPMVIYAARLATSRAACALGAREVHDLLAASATVYTAASSADQHATALHSARLLQQWEAMATVFSSTVAFAANASRDSSMAENVQWHVARAGASAKVVLWAHNDHIGRMPNTLGTHLRDAFPNDYVAVGFAFGSGVLNAVSGGTVQAVRPSDVPAEWIENAFLQTGKDYLLLDARTIPMGGAVAAPLAGPISMRSIGSTFNVIAPSGFYRKQSFPADFDLLVFVRSASETTLLPFVF